MEIETSLVPEADRKKKPEDALELSFGEVFTDHMFIMEYKAGQWQKPRILPYGPLSLDPAAMILHYGQGIFEGMKAYRRGKNCYLFRPLDNFRRLNLSAERMVMPTIDATRTLNYLKKLLQVEREWIPEEKGSALYLRPTMIASEPKLGVRPALEYLYYVILCPVGPYFKEGFNPVRLHVSERYVRAAQGGVGDAKTAGNYAASLLATQNALDRGFAQVLWLDANEHKYIEEAGTMNIFVRFEDEIATAPLDGTILPGITRDSVLRLAKDWGYKVVERRISINEILDGNKSGYLKEIFGSGTAAIITPVGVLNYKDEEHVIAGGGIGELTQHLYDEITGIQNGSVEDRYHWRVSIDD
jgi:branched-chain amino acid aminotransferase